MRSKGNAQQRRRRSGIRAAKICHISFLSPLLSYIGIKELRFGERELETSPACREVSWISTSRSRTAPRGPARYRKSIARYCGTQSFEVFLKKVNSAVEDFDGEDIERVAEVFALLTSWRVRKDTHFAQQLASPF